MSDTTAIETPRSVLCSIFEEALDARDACAVGQDSGNLYTATQPEMLAAYNVLWRFTPFIRFGHAAANIAIAEVTSRKPESKIHIVDIGIGGGMQWVDLFHRLRRGSSIRLTGVDLPAPGSDPMAALNQTGSRLREAAVETGIDLEFEGIASAVEEFVAPSRRPGEELVISAAFAMHHVLDGPDVGEKAGSRDAVLSRILGWQPALLVLIEPNAKHNQSDMSRRLAAAQRHYGAVFDALESLLPEEFSQEKRVIERSFFGREVMNIIGCEGEKRFERHELATEWQSRLVRLGATISDVEEWGSHPEYLTNLLQLHHDCSIVLSNGAIGLAWKGELIVSVMAWKP